MEKDLEALLFEKACEARRHSNFLALGRNNEVVKYTLNDICYASFSYTEWEDVDRLFVFFGQELRNHDYVDEWVDFMLNHPFFGEAFLTKDVDTAFTSGVEINIHAPYNKTKGSMILLRSFLERPAQMGWSRFRKLGFSKEESFILSNTLKLCENKEGKHLGLTSPLHSAHIIINEECPYTCYTGADYMKTKDLGSFIEMRREGAISRASHIIAPKYYNGAIILPEKEYYLEDDFGSTYMKVGVDLTKENCEEVLRVVKEG